MTVKKLRYFLQIAYKGTHYHGWQLQHNAPTIQHSIQVRMAQILQKSVQIVGSSRTDKGVHAKQQVAHVDLDRMVDPQQLHYQLNAILPPDIAIIAIQPVKSGAHARFDALARTYEYTLVQTKDPFLQDSSYWIRQTPAIAKMNEAAAILCQKKDFTSFSKTGSDPTNSFCTVMEAGWRTSPGIYIFRIKANRFLRGMVRIIVHKLLKVGTGTLDLSTFEAMLDQKDRSVTTGLVPACGLALTAVAYPDDIFVG